MSRTAGQKLEAAEADGARDLTDKFDGHMDAQKQCFLKPGKHQASKYHGKLRAKFDRLVLSMHVVDVVCQRWKDMSVAEGFDMSQSPWCDGDFSLPMVIPKKPIAVAYALAEVCENR